MLGLGCSYGVTVLPIGVATCTVSCGRGGPLTAALPTGLTLGDGGIARPNLGVRPPLGLPPASAGRRGAGDEDMRGMSVGAEVGGVPTAASKDAAVGAFILKEC